MGDDGWVTIKPDNDEVEKEVDKLDNDVLNKLSLSNIKTPSEEVASLASSEGSEPPITEGSEGTGATGNGDVENGNDVADETTIHVSYDEVNNEKDDVRRKKTGPLKFFKKMGSKESPDGDRLPSKSKARRTSQIPLELKVDSLPQVFVTKYLGSDVCTGLWGIQHTHGPVTKLVDNVSKLEKDEDLPLVQLEISNKAVVEKTWLTNTVEYLCEELHGIQIAMHKENTGRLLEEGLIPVEFISYGVQDIKFTRVFSFILVKEMSWRAKKMEVHAYVCDSTATCRRLSLSVALAFKEYAATLGGQPYKFHVDLRPPSELEKDLENAEADA